MPAFKIQTGGLWNAKHPQLYVAPGFHGGHMVVPFADRAQSFNSRKEAEKVVSAFAATFDFQIVREA